MHELGSLNELATALAKAQSEIEPPLKKCKVDFTNNKGQRVKYNYADLADVLSSCRGPLTKNGLSVSHTLEYVGEMYGLSTILMHSSGQILSTWYPLPDPLNSEIRAQEFGSALTYARRYSLSALVGIASEEDDDGGSAPPTKPPVNKPSTPPPKAPPTTPKPQVNQNYAPASQSLIESINSLCIDRGVQESELNHLIREGYGVKGAVPLWIAKEIFQLLENEDTNSATIMAQSQRVLSRREAARLTGAAT